MKSVLILCIFLCGLCFAQDNKFASIGVKNGNWTIFGDAEGMEFDNQLYKSFDGSIQTDSYTLGIFIDIGEDAKKAKSIGANIGFSKWSLFVEKGRINGRFESDSELDIQNSGEFINEYTYLAFHKPDRYGVLGGSSGFGMVHYTIPLRSEYNYGADSTVVFVDPKAKITILGWFSQFDKLRNYIEYGKTGFAFSVQSLIGAVIIKPSGEKDSQLIAQSGTSVDKDGELAAGAASTFRYGFIHAKKNDKYNYAFEIGYEARMHGTIMSFGDSDLNNSIDPGTHLNFLHGPYAKFAMKF